MSATERGAYNIHADSQSIIITTAAGKEMDITHLTKGFVINEDIDANYMTGEITIQDGVGLVEQLPLYGEEYVTIGFTSMLIGDGAGAPNNDAIINKTFKVDTVVNDDGGYRPDSTITLGLISAPASLNFNKRVNRSFSGLTSGEIVEHVLWNHLEMDPMDDEVTQGIGYIEECKFPKNMVSPNWRPFKLINFLAENSVSKEHGEACNIMFFENRTGFHFKSIDSIINGDFGAPIGDIEINPQKGPEYTSAGMGNVETIAKQTNISNKFNMQMNQQMGVFANTVIAHNMVKKTFVEYTMNYEDAFKINSLNSGAIWDKESTDFNPDSSISLVSDHGMYNVHDKCNFSPVARRKISMGVIANQRFNVTIHGNTIYTIGKLINVTAPSQLNDAGGEAGTIKFKKDDFMVSGTYIITKVKHAVVNNGGAYNCVLEIMKDSYDVRPEINVNVQF